jgi:BirA family biotin operon repressor/biotin-[acetyl-CoA-carboxylase] ligase
MLQREAYPILNKNWKEINFDLNTITIGKKIFHFKTIDSTNRYARMLIKENIDDGTVVIADTQTGGRGRKNRKWSSNIGGLWFSVILRPRISSRRGMVVTMAASISVTSSINKLYGLNAEIKWPNDVLINGKKVCGILTEIVTEDDEISSLVVGLGVNVNNNLGIELKKVATSLKIEIGKDLSIMELLSDIIRNFDKNYVKIKFDDYAFLKNKWNQYANIIGRKIEVTEENKKTTGVVIDVDNDGFLILKKGKKKVRIDNGDIKYL